jgi:hypothetical protein
MADSGVMKIWRELGKTSPFFITGHSQCKVLETTRLSHTPIPQNLFLENHDHTVCGHETSFLVEWTTQPFAKSFPTAGDGRSQFYRVPLLFQCSAAFCRSPVVSQCRHATKTTKHPTGANIKPQLSLSGNVALTAVGSAHELSSYRRVSIGDIPQVRTSYQGSSSRAPVELF